MSMKWDVHEMGEALRTHTDQFLLHIWTRQIRLLQKPFDFIKEYDNDGSA